MPYSTSEERQAVQDLRRELYERYSTVSLYPQGNFGMIVDAEDEKPVSKTIHIHTRGGCLTAVEGLPEGWSYEYHDHDDDN